MLTIAHLSSSAIDRSIKIEPGSTIRFDVSDYQNLTSLEGCPEEIDTIVCSYTKIQSLKGCSPRVKNVWCQRNEHLVSLEGCPRVVEMLSCSNTKITSLEGGPDQATSIWCFNTPLLKTLKGCPQSTVDNLDCMNSGLTTLEYCSPEINHLIVNHNSNLILRRVWEHLKRCTFYDQMGVIHPKSGVLGLLRVQDLEYVFGDEDGPLTIINKYLPLQTMSNVIRCKLELTNAGFSTNAVW